MSKGLWESVGKQIVVFQRSQTKQIEVRPFRSRRLSHRFVKVFEFMFCISNNRRLLFHSGSWTWHYNEIYLWSYQLSIVSLPTRVKLELRRELSGLYNAYVQSFSSGANCLVHHLPGRGYGSGRKLVGCALRRSPECLKVRTWRAAGLPPPACRTAACAAARRRRLRACRRPPHPLQQFIHTIKKISTWDNIQSRLYK